MSDTRADTTSMGLFLISFIMLVFGLIGIFGFLDMGGTNFLGLSNAALVASLGVGVLFLFCGWSAWKSDNKFLMIIFAFLALFMITFRGMSAIGGDGYLIFVIEAIFLIIFTLWALLAKSGYMLTLILLTAALTFLFYGLALNAGADGEPYFLIMGLCALVAFFFSTYMALADVTDINMPVM